ncbi:MAG: hypothetical protein ACJAZP_004080 [Psychromonas sp.]|uniref:succinylglutamate desuccinylase/aspartoacylase domain-containing protein n=1 Tax=Psychromonas sp. TaxID=1884585 RepID=UPI0039E6537A
MLAAEKAANQPFSCEKEAQRAVTMGVTISDVTISDDKRFSLQNNDFTVLNIGEPTFLTFAGRTLGWEGEDEVYPHFIGESASYHLNIAFALSRKTLI